MGKSNRIKVNKANHSTATLGDYKKSNGMPNWAINLIAVCVTLAILLGALALAITSNGTILRMRTAVRSDHFRVNGKTMTYFVNETYQNFLTTYSSYLSNLSLDTSKPLDEQMVGDTSVKETVYDSSVCGDFQGTWEEFFVSQAEENVKNYLLYCEIAYSLGLELGETEKQNIDNAILELEAAATQYNYPLNAYITMCFGQGVKEKDIRNALEIKELYSMAYYALGDKLAQEISDDRIHDAYAQDSTKYNRIDYSFYSFRVDYADVSKEVKEANANATAEQILEEYKKQIADAKAKAEALLATGSIEEFEKHLLTDLAAETYDEKMKTKTLPSEGKPNADDLNRIRDGIVAQAVKELMEKTESTDAVKQDGEKYVGYGVEMSKEWADAFNSLKLLVDDMLANNLENYVIDKSVYKDSDSFCTWAFDDARKVDDTYKNLTGDGSDADAEIKNEKGYFRADVYRLRSKQYKDTDKTHDISVMLFSSEKDAQAAIEALQAAGTVDMDVFNRVATEKNASTNDTIENYVEGDMNNVDFDAWIFKSDRKVGDYTDKPIKLSDASYAVLFYVAEGDETWFVSVKDALLTDDFSAYVENAKANTPIEMKANVLKKIKIGG